MGERRKFAYEEMMGLPTIKSTVIALLLLAVSVGCRDEQNALKNYISDVFPGLTAGAQEAVASFEGLLSNGADSKQLEQKVIRPYRKIVERLREFQPESDTVRRHHVAYRKAAEAQLEVFEAAREAVSANQSLAPVAKRLAQVQKAFKLWSDGLRAEAERLDILAEKGN